MAETGLIFNIFSWVNSTNVIEFDLEGNVNCFDLQAFMQSGEIPTNCKLKIKDSSGNVVMGADHYGTIYLVDQAHIGVTVPIITSIIPAYGQTTGGDSIVITGSGFQPDSEVTIDGNPCTSIVVTGTTSIACDTPAGSAGTKALKISNPNQGWYELTNGFLYWADPTVTAITPSTGNEGDTVTVTGTGFFADANETIPGVTINGVACTNVIFRNSTSLRCRVPANANGTYDVVVTNPDGATATLVNGFTYATAPTVTSVTPFFGNRTGGENITIKGTGFVDAPTISIGGNAATNVVFVSATEVTCDTPTHSREEAVDITVTNPSSIGGTLYGAFEYFTQIVTTLADAAGADAAEFEGLAGQIATFITSLGELKIRGDIRIGFN